MSERLQRKSLKKRKALATDIFPEDVPFQGEKVPRRPAKKKELRGFLEGRLPRAKVLTHLVGTAQRGGRKASSERD